MRVHGLDLLRGICAILVAVYHLLYWTDIARLYTWGLYAVYIFFVISGASLVIAYRDKFAAGFSASNFLLLRFARLAPLYVLVVAMSAFTLEWSRVALGLWLLNGTLTFGLGNPGAYSVVTGGWTIGIEFAYYLMFPVLLSVSASRARWIVAAMLVMTQLAFVHLVLAANPDWRVAWPLYTQPLAFIAYFYLGCLIGHLVMDGKVKRLTPLALLVVMTIILVSSGESQVSTVDGRGGFGLLMLSVLAVYLAAGLDLRGKKPVALATFLGDASYGVYLMHPPIYKAVTWLKMETPRNDRAHARGFDRGRASQPQVL